MRIQKVALLMFLFLLSAIKAQDSYTILVENFEKERVKTSKPTLIFIHADWCSFCKIQERRILKDKNIRTLLQEKVHYINLNAETYNKTIHFFGQQYQYIRNGNSGIHELAIYLSPNISRPNYPLWVLLDKNGNILFRHEGIMKNEELKQLLLF